MSTIDSFRSFWNGKRVLITGHCGFKGAWLSFVLSEYGSKVFGYGIDSGSSILYPYLSHVYCDSNQILDDILNIEQYSKQIVAFNPDIIVHLAAFATVQPSYSHPKSAWSSNVLGSQSLLELIRCNFPHVPLLAITTDKVYCDHSISDPVVFNESAPLSGFSDPYSSSKAACEFLISSYRYSYPHLQLFTARAGNVLGGGDRSPNRLLPDIISASSNKTTLNIRNPDATRPWQHVLDTVHAYISFMNKIIGPHNPPHTLNFAPSSDTYSPSVLEILEIAKRYLPDISFALSQSNEFKAEFNTLRLDSSLAASSGVWSNNLWSPELSVKHTILWEQEAIQTNPLLATKLNHSLYLTHFKSL